MVEWLLTIFIDSSHVLYLSVLFMNEVAQFCESVTGRWMVVWFTPQYHTVCGQSVVHVCGVCCGTREWLFEGGGS